METALPEVEIPVDWCQVETTHGRESIPQFHETDRQVMPEFLQL